MNDDKTPEQIWQEFWQPLLAPSGEPDIELIKNELSDYYRFMHDVSEVYDVVSGGKISKPNTHARHVIAANNDLIDRRCDDAVQEAIAENLPLKPTDAMVKRFSEAFDATNTAYSEVVTDIGFQDRNGNIDFDPVFPAAVRAGLASVFEHVCEDAA